MLASEGFVLDAWAVLALLQKEEPAADRVRQVLQEALDERADVFVSVINLGEVYYRVGKARGEVAARATLRELRELTVTIISATDDRVFAAARLKMQHSISYADAFAAASAAEFGATLLTGDPELEQLVGTIRIEKLARSRR